MRSTQLHRSFEGEDCSEEHEVLFCCTRGCSRRQNPITVFVVSHPPFNCPEILASDLLSGIESPQRVYLDEKRLSAIILSRKVDEHEAMVSQGNIYFDAKLATDPLRIKKQAIIGLMSQFLFNRLWIEADDVCDESDFRIVVAPFVGDAELAFAEDVSTLDVVVSKPPKLKPFQLPVRRQEDILLEKLNSHEALTQEDINGDEYSDLSDEEDEFIEDDESSSFAREYDKSKLVLSTFFTSASAATLECNSVPPDRRQKDVEVFPPLHTTSPNSREIISPYNNSRQLPKVKSREVSQKMSFESSPPSPKLFKTLLFPKKEPNKIPANGKLPAVDLCSQRIGKNYEKKFS